MFKIIILFLIMSVLFLQGQVVLNAFNLTTDGILSNKFTNEEIINVILDCHLFFICYIFGLCIPKQTNEIINKYQSTDKLLVKIGYILLLLALPFELYVNLTRLKFTKMYGYASNYQSISLNSISSGAKILSYFFMPACLFIFFGSNPKSRNEKVAIGMIILHAILEMLIGYRANAMIPLILMIYGLSVKSQNTNNYKLSNKIKKQITKFCVLAIIVIIFIFPLIRNSRNNGGLLKNDISEYFSIEQYKDLFKTFNDMGKSMQTIIYTKKIVPNSSPYRYGYTYLIYSTTIIPNFFWDRHPAETYGSLGKWITQIVDPEFYKFGGSLGFSCVAEFYVNFGYLGIIIFSILLGFSLEKIEKKIDLSKKSVDYASISIVAIYLMSFSRGESGDLFRGIFWYMLIPRIMYYIFLWRRKKNVWCSYTNKEPTWWYRKIIR